MGLEGEGLALAARLAGASLLRAAPARPVGPFAAGEVAELLRHPAFGRPLSAMLARTQPEPWPPVRRLAELAAVPEGRLAILIASEPQPRVAVAARLLAAAILHKNVLRIALKADRERLRAAFGADAFDLATQEAPTLHAGLAALDADPAVWPAVSDGDAEAGVGAALGFGLSRLAAFAEGVEPCLGALARRRLAAETAPALGEAARGLVLKLLRRRMPSWPAIIG